MADLRLSGTFVWKDGSGVYSNNSHWTGLSDADKAKLLELAAPVGAATATAAVATGDRYIVLKSSEGPDAVVLTDKAGLEAVEQAMNDFSAAALAYAKSLPA